jgi:DNA-binding beta-propeller fold protein YncE
LTRKPVKFKGVFVPTGDDLVTPTGIAVGPDGNLYVSSREANVVLRFDGNTGGYMDTFVSPGSQALNGPMGLAFGSDGNLYVTSCYDHRLVRFNGKTGDFAGVVVSQDQGMQFPTRVTTGGVPFLMAVPPHN